MKRDGGIVILEEEDQEALQNLFHKLSDYGLFVIPIGELESWLNEICMYRSHGPSWLVEMFEKMGEDPNLPNYLKPADGDVWSFM